MRRDAPRPETRAAALFALVAALAFWRLWRLRYLGIWIDESDNLVVGWLLTRGHVLYDTIFSHHMPLTYAWAQLVAWLSPTDDPAHFRATTWLFYTMSAFSLVRSPVTRDAPDRGWVAASLFLALAAVLAPQWSGFRLQNEIVWGSLFVVFGARLLLPACLGLPLRRRDGAIGGAALAAAASGSLAAFYPVVASLVLLVALAAVSPRRRAELRAAAPAALLAAAAVAALEIVWLLRFADLGGFVDEAIRFNLEIYGRYRGYGEGGGGAATLATRGLGGALGWFAGRIARIASKDLDPWFAAASLGSAFALGTLAAQPAARRPAARWLTAALLGAALLLLSATLRLRGEGMFVAPFYLWTLGTIAVAAAVLESRAGRRSALLALVGLAALLAPRVGGLRWDFDEPDLGWSLGWMRRSFAVIESATGADERILSLNVTPIAYLLTRREPAHRAVFYLPWQADWEQRHPERPDSCEQVRSAPPRYVFLWPTDVAGQRWGDYGACLDEFVRRNYQPVAGAPGVWLRDDAKR